MITPLEKNCSTVCKGLKGGIDETVWVFGKFSKTRLKRMFTVKLNVCRMVPYQVSCEQSQNGLRINSQ